MARPTPVVLLVTCSLLGLAGCRNREAIQFCEQFETRFVKCSPNAADKSALDSMRTYCRVSMAYEPAPDDHPDNLAALTRAALEKCGNIEDCDEFMACLEENGCAWFVMGPDDTDPTFSCTPH